MASFPPPDGHFARVQAVQAVLGAGIAPALETIADSLSDGYLIGGSNVAAGFAEAFLMQLGGKLPVGWGRLDPGAVYELLKTHIYIRGVQDRALPLAAHSHSYMAQVVLEHLATGRGTLMLVGHDGDLDALATLFGLGWHTNPFPPNATTPGSALRIDAAADGTLDASVLYQSFDPADPGTVHTVQAEWSAREHEHLEQLRQWVELRLDPTCVPPQQR
eukprot:TRINITY_DN13709_c0_g1_i2.p1 TRINITY_DN13709_c0_g1~~TRINITY_DN13709_c0_g1_i2.p1  ORF type:complete len:218 (-),score=31.44 TRINITY_DN13709_c0_g1_i2:245-898(-)